MKFVQQVGTLDILVGLSDELGKLDVYCERSVVDHFVCFLTLLLLYS